HDEFWRAQLLIELTDVQRPDYVAAIAREGVEGSRQLAPRLVQLVRDKVLASAQADGVSEHAIAEALRQLEALDIDLGFEWILRRLDWIGRNDRRVSFRDVPDDVIALLRERSELPTWRDELAQLVERFE